MIARILSAALLTAVLSYTQTFKDSLEQVNSLKNAGKIDQAQQLAQMILSEARQANDNWAQAQAHRRLGQVFLRRSRHADARIEFDRALMLFQGLSDRTGVGHIYYELGYLEFLAGNRAGERDFYLKALAEYESAGSDADADRAVILFQLVNLSNDLPQKKRLIEQGLDLAQRGGDERLRGLLLMRWGDVLLAEGNYADATSKVEQSIALLEAQPAINELGAALDTLARIYRAHGLPEKALEANRRGLALAQRAQDPLRIVQSLDSIAVTHERMGQPRETLEYAERALTQARQAGSAQLLRRQLLRLGSVYAIQGEYAKSVKVIEEAIAARGNANDIPWRHLAFAYRALKDPRALSAADRAVDLSRRGAPETLSEALRIRALIHEEAGNLMKALADVEEGLRIIEQRRVGAVQTDAMKRGFAEQNEKLFSLGVEILHRMGNYRRAMETAEQARGRAFLDLMATRGVQLKPHDQQQIANLQNLDRELRAANTSGIAMRGAPVQDLLKRWRSANAELRSFVTAEPHSWDSMVATCRRLNSILLAYWVNATTTYVWIVKPDGAVEGASIAVPKDQLAKTITDAWSGAFDDRTRGAGELALATRGGDGVVLSRIRNDSWRRLYQWLIRPVQRHLPKDPGALLTIVPHGPLFQLSFAALQEEDGRYLVERYRLHYAPAGAALDYTEQKKASVAGSNPQFLLVADPAAMTTPDGKRLPALPGSRSEVSSIARIVSPARTTVLTGQQAGEQAVKTGVSGKTVIHLATHGIVRNDDPSESFIALSGSNGGAWDGRLTAAEVYQLELNTDLVVLSACRSALGKVSTDGIVGFTRAFFYAGASSVLASMWDVADGPTSRLMTEFYNSYVRDHDKSHALRQAQLRLISALRRGRIRVSTALGSVTLPEQPLFWAGFALMGEP